jgi:hypothetical protein
MIGCGPFGPFFSPPSRRREFGAAGAAGAAQYDHGVSTLAVRPAPPCVATGERDGLTYSPVGCAKAGLTWNADGSYTERRNMGGAGTILITRNMTAGLPTLEAELIEQIAKGMAANRGMQKIVADTIKSGHTPYMTWTGPLGKMWGAFWNAAAKVQTIKPVDRLELIDFTNCPEIPFGVDAANPQGTAFASDMQDTFFGIVAKIEAQIPADPPEMKAYVLSKLKSGVQLHGETILANTPEKAALPTFMAVDGLPFVSWQNDSGIFGFYCLANGSFVVGRVPGRRFAVDEKFEHSSTRSAMYGSLSPAEIAQYNAPRPNGPLTFPDGSTMNCDGNYCIVSRSLPGTVAGYVRWAIANHQYWEHTRGAWNHFINWLKMVGGAIVDFVGDVWKAIVAGYNWLKNKICELANSPEGALLAGGIGCATAAAYTGGMGVQGGRWGRRDGQHRRRHRLRSAGRRPAAPGSDRHAPGGQVEHDPQGLVPVRGVRGLRRCPGRPRAAPAARPGRRRRHRSQGHARPAWHEDRRGGRRQGGRAGRLRTGRGRARPDLVHLGVVLGQRRRSRRGRRGGLVHPPPPEAGAADRGALSRCRFLGARHGPKQKSQPASTLNRILPSLGSYRQPPQ